MLATRLLKNKPTKSKADKKQKHKEFRIKLRDLIIAEILGALISGLIAGLVHLAYNSFHLENKIENVCDILNAKDQASCKKVIDSAMDATEENMDNYTVQIK